MAGLHFVFSRLSCENIRKFHLLLNIPTNAATLTTSFSTTLKDCAKQ